MLDKITPEGKDFLLTVSPDELHLKLELASLVSNVNYALTARRMNDEVFLDGELSYSLCFSCARCLDEFVAPFSQPLNLVIQLVADNAVENEDCQDCFVVFPESKKVFELDQHLRDLITLEVPLKPLCKVDCLGLCPQCGTNLNESRCQCKVNESDPRWEELRKFSNRQ